MDIDCLKIILISPTNSVRLKKRLQGGFTLLELALVAAIVALMAAFALDRLQGLLREAERVAVLQVEANISSALGMEVSRRAVRGGLSGIVAMEGKNPMDFLGKQPANYQGVSVLAEVDRGYWGFDEGRGVLVYRVHYVDGFSSSLDGVPRIEYRLSYSYQDVDGDGRFNQATDELTGLMLAQQGDYHWSQARVR